MAILILIGVLGLVAMMLSTRAFVPVASRSAARAAYLDACVPHFTSVQKGLSETGFARISGRYRGQLFDVQVVPDSLNLRKLPTLWLLVTLVDRVPVAGTFDVMLRATGIETFSKFGSLPELTGVPAGFPEGCTIRSDLSGEVPNAALIARFLGRLDPARLKELVVAPTALRLVWLAEEADRGRYLIYRDAEMGKSALAPDMLLPLMDGLCGLLADIRAAKMPKLRVV